MDPVLRAQIQRSVDAWKSYSEAAEAMRRKELRELDENGGPDWRVVVDWFAIALMHGPDRQRSGLIEQQRDFEQLRARTTTSVGA